MGRIALTGVLILALGIGVDISGQQAASAQQPTDPRVADLVRAGKVRVGLGLGVPTVAIKDPATGEVRGPALELGRALAARIGIDFVPVEYPRPGAVMEGVRTGFSPPYIEYDLTFMVPAGSSVRNVADADQPGIRIAVERGGAGDIRLSRILKRAELIRTDTVAAGLDLLRVGLGVAVYAVDVRGPDDLEGGLAAIVKDRPQGLLVVDDPLFIPHRRSIVEFAAKHRLPAIYPFREYVEAGGLMAYSVILLDLARRGASSVDKILRGAKPPDLPIEQPTTFELVVNRRTAHLLGLTIPPSVLARVDQIIE